MKYFLFLFVGLLSVTSLKTDASKTKDNLPFVVLQLFTSQGCSSCPSADAFLEIVKKNYADKNVIVMSYHVDYWNDLGWKDPFSKKEYTTLQYTYGEKLKSENIYTPQVVVNGKEHYVGSYKKTITRSITSNLKKKPTNNLDFTEVKKQGNTIRFNYTIEGDFSQKELQIALVVENEVTKVKRGENKNRTISNSNIVMNTTTVSLDKNSGIAAIQIPKNINSSKKLRLIGLVQNKELHISGATQVEL